MGRVRAVQSELDRAVASLQRGLGDNLYTCILYGSAARDEELPATSDINLLLVLQYSTADAHRLIADIVRQHPRINPLVLGLPGLQRSQRVFALKFRSIKRHYRVLGGADVLADFAPDPALVRFLSEQAVRNLRLRHKHAYITFGRLRKRYTRYVTRSVSAIDAALAEALLSEQIDLPRDPKARGEQLEQQFGADASVLEDLRRLKQAQRTMSALEVEACYVRLLALLTAALRWMEVRWPKVGNP